MLLKWLVPIAGVALAGAAAAQDYTPAPPLIRGEITQSDQASAGGRRYDEYPVELVRGQRILITAARAAGSRVVPGIEIHPYGAAAPISLRPGDADGGNGQLLFVAPASGVFNIRIVSASPAGGRYTVSIQRNVARGINRGPTGISAGVPSPPTPDPAPDPATGGAVSTSGPPGPLSRFIICPGHPRCPRR